MSEQMMKNWGMSLLAGACGAVALTAVHQIARRFSDRAPRMDVVGERGIASALRAQGMEVPAQPALHRAALAGDLIANSAYYSLVACGPGAHMWRRGVVLGLLAGAGALVLPRPMGLGDPPMSHDVRNQLMTISWYLVGGLAAAAAGQGLQGSRLAAAA